MNNPLTRRQIFPLMGAAAGALSSPAGLAATGPEIKVLSPGVTYNAGLEDLALSFQRKAGVRVKIVKGWMTSILRDAQSSRVPPDVVILPVDLMGTLALEEGLSAAGFQPLGRVTVGLAVMAGALRPDISTVAKLVAVLRSARRVVYSDPATGSMQAAVIARMLARPEFSGVNSAVSTEGEGGLALRRGEGDMALQLVCEILPHKEIALVGPVPAELGAHIDSAVAISARALNRRAAAAFVSYMLEPASRAVWQRKGLERF